MILWAAMALAAMGNVMASTAVNDDTVTPSQAWKAMSLQNRQR